MSSSSMSSTIPPWLKASHSPSHLSAVLHALAKRERIRDGARVASRHQSHPSKTHRYAHLASSVFPKSDHVDYYSVSVGFKPVNQWGNRYLELEPYDRTRVIVGEGDQVQLQTGDGTHSSEGRYLNASWVRECFGGKWWIATQAPLPRTAHAFLSVLLQPTSRPPPPLFSPLNPRTSRIRTVVQLTPNFENGRQKAHVYFPTAIGESWEVPAEPGCYASSLKVTLLDSVAIDDANCIQSTVSIAPMSRQNEEPVIFRHMLYHAWPDHGVPEPQDHPSLISFIRLVDRTNKDISLYRDTADLDPDPPIMVGCSAGIGRTGSFIALSSLFRAHNLMSPATTPVMSPSPYSPSLPSSPLGALPGEFKSDLVAQEVDSLREQRPGMVQREEQILLVYEMLSEAFLE